MDFGGQLLKASAEQLRAATQLGYNDSSWRNLKVSRPTSRLYDDLPKAGRDALRVLGFTREQWDRLRPAVGGSAVGGGTGSIVSAGSTESVQSETYNGPRSKRKL